MSNKLRPFLVVIFILATLSFALICESDAKDQVIFEKIGEYTSGGMAVALLAIDDLVYLCEFDRGVAILDISDPENIVEIGRLPDTRQSRGIAIVDRIAYVSCNVNGLKLFDVSTPSSPTYITDYSDRNGDPHQFVPLGDIGYLTEWHGGLDVIDLSHPEEPRRIGEYRAGGYAFSVEIIDQLAYVTMYDQGLAIFDVSDPEHPVLIGGHNNGGETNVLHVVGTIAYVCDKEQGLEIIDVSDPTAPELLSTFDVGDGTAGVRVIGDVAFIIHWERGLVATDVSDPANPVEIGSFFDGGMPNGIWVEGNIIYVADGPDGLEILRFSLEEDE